MKRAYGRAYDQVRPITVTYDVLEYAAASVLFEQGRTKVLCAVTLQNSVPPFLKGKKTGWLTAEYAMLPAATQVRKERDSLSKPNGRSIEISRLIGRVLRSVVDLDLLGERTIVIDCDVLQADGSTRTACITAASRALSIASQRWLRTGRIGAEIVREEIAGVSVGTVHDAVMLDLDFNEDSSIESDFNFVITRSGKVVEIQGSAEKNPISWASVEKMHALALKGIGSVFSALHESSSERKQEKQITPFNAIRLTPELNK
jgi:ribonuclease PH